MRITITLIISIFLMSCSTIKDCGVKPNVDIVIKNDQKTGEETRTTVDVIKDSVQPGGQVNCTF